MASMIPSHLLSLCLSLLIVLLPVALCADTEQVGPVTHHGGRVLTGKLNVGILWYGQIQKAQRRAILSFFRALSANDLLAAGNLPQVSSWWNIVESYQTFTNMSSGGNTKIPVKVVNQAFDPDYSLGKVLIKDFIQRLIPKANNGNPNILAIIIAFKGVTVQNMCAGSCAQHGLIDNQPYVALGDPVDECPECAWPFVKSTSLQGATLKPPSGNIGADAMVMLLAGGLAGAVTNPYGDGFYVYARGERLIEATSKCPNLFSTGNLPLNPVNGGAFNAVGPDNTRFLLPAIWNPKSSSCWTPL